MNLPTPPAWLARIGPRLPARFVSLHWVAALEMARLAGWLTPPAELEGRRFRLTIHDLGLTVDFSCRKGRFRLAPAGQAELQLGAKLADYAALARGQTDADTLFFQRRLQISGDTELGLIVKNWLDASERPGWLMH